MKFIIRTKNAWEETLSEVQLNTTILAILQFTVDWEIFIHLFKF